MKANPRDFMGRRAGRSKTLALPSIVVVKTSLAKSGVRSKRKTAFNVDSLTKVVEAFDENERSLKQEQVPA